MRLRRSQRKKRNDIVYLLTEALLERVGKKDEEIPRTQLSRRPWVSFFALTHSFNSYCIVPQVKEDLEDVVKVAAAEEDMLEIAVAADLILLFIPSFFASSSMMTACIYFLAKNPEVQEKLFQGLDSIV